MGEWATRAVGAGTSIEGAPEVTGGVVNWEIAAWTPARREEVPSMSSKSTTEMVAGAVTRAEEAKATSMSRAQKNPLGQQCVSSSLWP